MAIQLTANERFDAKVSPEPNSGCWLWTGGVNEHGYGIFCVKSKFIKAHRYSYAREYGALDAGIVVMHKCDNPACVNPQHLKTGTQLDNIADMFAKKRDRRGIQKGEANGCAKLTEQDVLAIRTSSLSLSDAATEYGLAKTTIWNIRTGRSWKHI